MLTSNVAQHCFLVALLLVFLSCSHLTDAQRWRNSNSRWNRSSCPSLKGCYLTQDGKPRNDRNYLSNRDTNSVEPGKYHMTCDMGNEGSINLVQFQSSQRSSFHQYFAPYEYRDIRMERPGETVRIMVNGWTWWSACFRETFTFSVDDNAAAEICSSNYKCPANSNAIRGRSCIKTFGDCACNDGYEKDMLSAQCIKSCTANYRCPVNSERIFGRDCYESFKDCQCKEGYERNEQTQSCDWKCAHYQCPANARPRRNRTCISSFRDCRCTRGFEANRREETCDPICYSTYQCPADSKPKAGVRCLESFKDCQCKDGFVKDEARGVCVPACPDYTCPLYSQPIYGRTCIRSFNDCECDEGFLKDVYQQTCKMAVTQPRIATRAPRPAPTPAPVAVVASGQIVPTQCEVDALIDLMEQAVEINKALSPQWLRLSFHDAGTFDQRQQVGGANGCLLTDKRMRLEMENDSLDLALEPLELIQSTWTGKASAADLIQFAGFFAVIRQRGTPGLTPAKRRELEETFEWGRPDETNCQVEWTQNLPGFQLDVEDPTDIPFRCRVAGEEIKKKMMDRNGFSAFEATALIGAHTIGLTRNVFTDRFAGPWAQNGHDEATPQGPVFDNGFHSFLVDDVVATSVEDFAANRNPFTTDFPTWFRFDDADINHLDTDIVLAFPSQDLSVHPDYHEFTTQFANDNQFFLDSFMAAFRKMSRLGVQNRLFSSAPCAPQAMAAFTSMTDQQQSPQRNADPYASELETVVARANVLLQQTAEENRDLIDYLTTPL